MDRRKQGASEDVIFQVLGFLDDNAPATIRKSPRSWLKSV